MNRNATNLLIDEIRDTPTDDIMDLAQKWKKHLKGSFIQNKLPTEEYKTFLLHIVERIPSFTLDENDKIYRFLFLWEQEALTGMMFVRPGEPMYDMYHGISQAIFGDNKIPGMSADGSMEISNTNVTIMIFTIRDGCQFRPCKRKNPLHRLLMHEKKEGGKRSTRKRSTRKRSTLKRRTRRTHKN
jgi:hypothetical protein